MTSVPHKSTFTSAETLADSHGEQLRLQFSAEAPLFRFGLRQLFLFVAAVCALLTAMASSTGLTALVLLLASTIVVMHVFATALSTKLQSRTEQQRFRDWTAQQKSEESISSTSERSAKLQAIRSAPRSPWHGRGCTY